MDIFFIWSVQVENYLKYKAYKQAQKWPYKAQLTPAVMDILGFKSVYFKSSPHTAGLHVWYGPMQLHISIFL